MMNEAELAKMNSLIEQRIGELESSLGYFQSNRTNQQFEAAYTDGCDRNQSG